GTEGCAPTVRACRGAQPPNYVQICQRQLSATVRAGGRACCTKARSSPWTWRRRCQSAVRSEQGRYTRGGWCQRQPGTSRVCRVFSEARQEFYRRDVVDRRDGWEKDGIVEGS